MSTYEHEAPLRLLQDDPAFAEELYCGLLGRKLPGRTEVRPGSEAMTRGGEAVVRNCDNVAVYFDGDAAVQVLLFEVQRGKDTGKRYSRLDCIASARSRFHCPVTLVVITFDRRTAGWAREPIETGRPGLILIPLVIGPEQIPVITDPAAGRGREALMALSVVAHAYGEHTNAVMTAFKDAIRPLDQEDRTRYAAYALNALQGPASTRLEEVIMTDTTLPNPYRAGLLGEKYREGKAEGKAEGLAEGERNLLLCYIDQRGIPAAPQTRERIEA